MPERFPGVEVRIEWPDKALKELDVNYRTAVIFLTPPAPPPTRHAPQPRPSLNKKGALGAAGGLLVPSLLLLLLLLALLPPLLQRGGKEDLLLTAASAERGNIGLARGRRPVGLPALLLPVEEGRQSLRRHQNGGVLVVAGGLRRARGGVVHEASELGELPPELWGG